MFGTLRSSSAGGQRGLWRSRRFRRNRPAGFGSQRQPLQAVPNGEAGGAGQIGLIFVKGEEFVRAGLASDGDVEEIHGTDGQVAGMDGVEFVGGAAVAPSDR